MGGVNVPDGLYYGASTQRAIDNFPVSRRRFEREFIEALAIVKRGAAKANKTLKKLDARLANAIIDASLTEILN